MPLCRVMIAESVVPMISTATVAIIREQDILIFVIAYPITATLSFIEFSFLAAKPALLGFVHFSLPSLAVSLTPAISGRGPRTRYRKTLTNLTKATPASAEWLG
jgi:hypothetical protein